MKSSISIYTNSESIKIMFPDVDFKDIYEIRNSILNEGKSIAFTKSLTGESLDVWDRIVFINKDSDRVTGVLCLSYLESGFQFNKDHQYSCTFVSVHNDYKGKGIATNLIESMFSFADSNGIKLIKQSSYDVDFIKKTFDRCADNYKTVEFVNRQ